MRTCEPLLSASVLLIGLGGMCFFFANVARADPRRLRGWLFFVGVLLGCCIFGYGVHLFLNCLEQS